MKKIKAKLISFFTCSSSLFTRLSLILSIVCVAILSYSFIAGIDRELSRVVQNAEATYQEILESQPEVLELDRYNKEYNKLLEGCWNTNLKLDYLDISQKLFLPELKNCLLRTEREYAEALSEVSAGLARIEDAFNYSYLGKTARINENYFSQESAAESCMKFRPYSDRVAIITEANNIMNTCLKASPPKIEVSDLLKQELKNRVSEIYLKRKVTSYIQQSFVIVEMLFLMMLLPFILFQLFQVQILWRTYQWLKNGYIQDSKPSSKKKSTTVTKKKRGLYQITKSNSY